jgi:hypothetical protein
MNSPPGADPAATPFLEQSHCGSREPVEVYGKRPVRFLQKRG